MTKAVPLCHTYQRKPKEYPFLLWWGTQQLLHASSTTLFLIVLRQVFRAQHVVYRQQSASPTAKTVQLGQKDVNIVKQLYFLFWCEIR